jgi:hypothetical protein
MTTPSAMARSYNTITRVDDQFENTSATQTGARGTEIGLQNSEQRR